MLLKGYVFTLDHEADPLQVLASGTFSVRQAPKEGQWSAAMLATFADFSTIAPGDLVFFFRDRRVYGAGQVISFEEAPHVGAWWAWKGAADPGAEPPSDAEFARRVVVCFRPFPTVFPRGIDMDELLGDARARSDWALRFFWKASFIQMDDDETRTLLASFVRRFLKNAPTPKGGRGPAARGLAPFSLVEYVQLRPDLSLGKGNTLRSENVLHGLLVERMRQEPSLLLPSTARASDGDRLFHEVAASPPKPADYVDWLDILRLRSWRQTPDTIPHGWDVIECKKDSYDSVGSVERVVSQLMKYVDFVSREKAARDYGAVSGHYIAAKASSAFLQEFKELAKSGNLERTYVLDPHEDSPLHVWRDFNLWTYTCEANATVHLHRL